VIEEKDMNVLSKLTARIEKRLTETKNPCKMYSTYDRADQEGRKRSEMLKEYWGVSSAPYLVVSLSNGKFTPAFDINAVIGNARTGGYVAANIERFYQY
jgi:hypothetical protein